MRVRTKEEIQDVKEWTRVGYTCLMFSPTNGIIQQYVRIGHAIQAKYHPKKKK